MKTIKCITLGILLLVGISNQAQVSVNVNFATPSWGPRVTTQEYYYLPDVNSYYDIRASQFIYLSNGSWIRARQLPSRYRSYNLNTGHVVVLNDYRGHSPYVNYKNHKVKYNKGNNGNGNNGKGNNGKGKGNKGKNNKGKD